MVAALTADGSEAINRKLESTHISSSESSYFSSFYSSSYFEVEKTVSWLLDTDFNNKAVSSSSVPLRIALQFPDSLLPYAQSVINDITGGLIEKEEKSTAKTPGFQFYLLADTSYSSCCIDIVASQHASCNALIHYGRACQTRSPKDSIPILYIYGRAPLTPTSAITEESTKDSLDGKNLTADKDYLNWMIIQEIAKEFVAIYSQSSATNTSSSTNYTTNATVIVMADTVYLWALPVLHESVEKVLNNDNIRVLVSSSPSMDDIIQDKDTDVSPSSSSSSSTSTTTIFYLGGESTRLTNLLITHSLIKCITYDPTSSNSSKCRLESVNVNSLLMKRYLMIQKARDAAVVGIVVGTLGVASYRSVITSLHSLITLAGKTPYLISVGKPTPAKLGNFLEIDVFVFVACAESVVELALNHGGGGGEYMRPIVSVFEMEMALGGGECKDVLGLSSSSSPSGSLDDITTSTTPPTRIQWLPGVPGPQGNYMTAFVPIAQRLQSQVDESIVRISSSSSSKARRGIEYEQEEEEDQGNKDINHGEEEEEPSDEEPEFSLATGTYIASTRRRYTATNSSHSTTTKSSALTTTTLSSAPLTVIRTSTGGTLVLSSRGDKGVAMGTGFLQSKRTYRGLDPLLGREEEDTVGKEVDDSLTSSSSSAVVVATTTHIVAATKSKASILEEGRGGIASGYTYMGDVRR